MFVTIGKIARHACLPGDPPHARVQAVWASLPAPLPVHVMVGLSGPLPPCLLQTESPLQPPPPPTPSLDRTGVLWSALLQAAAATPASAGLA